MDSSKLTVTELETLLRKPRSTFKNWRDRGMPVITEGEKTYYDLAAVFEWYAQDRSGQTRGKASAATRKAAENASEQELRLRNMAADAERKEIELEQLKQTLVDIEVFADAYANECAIIKTTLNMIPRKLAPMLVSKTNPADVQRTLEAEVNYVLSALSNEGLPGITSGDTETNT